MIRGAATTAAVSAAVAALILTGHHPHRRPAPAGSVPHPAPAPPVQTSRGAPRPPLPAVAHKSSRAQGRARPTAGSGAIYADTTEYCATGSRNASGRWPQLGDVAVLDRSIPFGARVVITGNVYVVRDWIGSGSDFDIYGGGDAGCEQRALNYGRRHLRVVVER